ncbi:MAG: RNA methyltransferase [Paludibacteraceae bacterium]|nr:RNA methyltransferase [Paludibacteraceae bacterium]
MPRKLLTEEILRLSSDEFKRADKLPLVVVLDNVRSLHNVGSVFRTADAYRVQHIVLCGITATPPSAEIHKSALGAENSVDWSYAESSVEACRQLKEQGYVLLPIELAEGSTSLTDVSLDKNKRYAVVLGNEVSGVNQEIIDMGDGCIELPQFGTKHSLNVSVTAGIVIWEFWRGLH